MEDSTNVMDECTIVEETSPDHQSKGSINYLLNDGCGSASQPPQHQKAKRSKMPTNRSVRRKAGSAIIAPTSPTPVIRGRKSGSCIVAPMKHQSRRRTPRKGNSMEESSEQHDEDTHTKVPNLPPISSLLPPPRNLPSPQSFSFSPINSPTSSPRTSSSPRLSSNLSVSSPMSVASPSSLSHSVSWSSASESSPSVSATADSLPWSHDAAGRPHANQHDGSASQMTDQYHDQQRVAQLAMAGWPAPQAYAHHSNGEADGLERSPSDARNRAGQQNGKQGQHVFSSPSAMMMAFGHSSFSTSSPSLLPPRHLHTAQVGHDVQLPVSSSAAPSQLQCQQQYEVPNNTSTSATSSGQAYRQLHPYHQSSGLLPHNNPPPPPRLQCTPGQPARQPEQNLPSQHGPYSPKQYHPHYPHASPAAILASFGQGPISMSAPSLLPSMVSTAMPPLAFPPSLRGDKIHSQWIINEGRTLMGAPTGTNPGASPTPPALHAQPAQTENNGEMHDGQQGSSKRAKRAGRGANGGSDFTFLHLQVGNDGRLTMVKELN